MAMEHARLTIKELLDKASAEFATAQDKAARETAELKLKWAMASFSHKRLQDMLAQAGAGTARDVAFADFKKCADTADEYTGDCRWFVKRMGQLGYEVKPINGVRVFRGLALLADDDDNMLALHAAHFSTAR